jgi:uncharacterized protein (TIGR02246 family)
MPKPMARFLPDGTFTNVNGEFYVGREEFDRRHAQVFAGVFRGTALSLTMKKLRLVRPDVAIADIDTEVAGTQLRPQGVAVGPDGVLRSRLLMVLLKEEWGLVHRRLPQRLASRRRGARRDDAR